MVADNPMVRGFTADHLRWAFTASPTGAYQPLAYLTWMLDHALWGADARGYHLSGVLLHALAAALACLAARRLYALAAPGSGAADRDLAAVFAALVFALHPLRAESVSWIAERRDPLSGVLWLGALIAYLRAREPGRPRGSLAAVHALYAAACLSKGTAVTLPAVLLVLDAWPLRRRMGEALREKLPMLALGAALGALAVARQAQDDASWSLADHGAAARLAQSAFALLFYVRRTLWPAGLSPFYELRAPLDPSEARFTLSALALALCCAAAWRQRGERPWLAAAGAAYVLVLLPLSGLLQAGSQLVADRYSYIACLPLAALAGGGLLAALGRVRAPALAAAAACLIGLAAACVAQQAHWSDDGALWERALALDPRSPTGHLNLGTEHARRGRLAEAESSFREALESDPECPRLLAGLGTDEAAARAGLSTRPVCRRAIANLGAVAAQRGRLEEARSALLLALEAEPDAVAARRNLAKVEALLRERPSRRGAAAPRSGP